MLNYPRMLLYRLHLLLPDISRRDTSRSNQWQGLRGSKNIVFVKVVDVESSVTESVTAIQCGLSTIASSVAGLPWN